MRPTLTIVLTLSLLIQPGCSISRHASSSGPTERTPQQTSPSSLESANTPKVASVYADTFQGRTTASGEKFDQAKLTAASKTYRLGSNVRVTNKKTGKSAVVKITDRGPFAKNRDIDLSRAAAQAIGADADGIAKVHTEALHD